MILEEDLKNIIRNLNKRFYDRREEVRLNRLEWEPLHGRVSHIFDKTIEQCKRHNFYETLYTIDSKNHNSINEILKKISNSKSDDKIYDNLNFIQLNHGFAPMGIIEGNSHMKRHIIENKGGISIVQYPSSKVSIIIYPSSSELIRYREKYIIYKLYRKPSHVKDKDIWNAIKFMFKLSLYTSYVSQISPSWCDRITIFYRIKKSKIYACAVEEIVIRLLKELIRKAPI
jgi:hypothetical protein